jgi:hypothetical protein
LIAVKWCYKRGQRSLGNRMIMVPTVSQ